MELELTLKEVETLIYTLDTTVARAEEELGGDIDDDELEYLYPIINYLKRQYNKSIN